MYIAYSDEEPRIKLIFAEDLSLDLRPSVALRWLTLGLKLSTIQDCYRRPFRVDNHA